MSQDKILKSSGIKLFSKNGITADCLLPYNEFVLYSDLLKREVDPDKAEKIIKIAEVYFDEDLQVLPLSLFRDFKLTGVRSRYEVKFYRRRDMIIYLTLAELYRKNGRYIDKLADVIWAVLEESSWVIPAHMDNSPNDPETSVPDVYDEATVPALDLSGASTCAALALARYLLGNELDKISPVICRKIDHLVFLRGIRPFITVTYWWNGLFGYGISNWLPNITSNILTACALTVKDDAIRKRVVNKALKLLDVYSSYYPEDGACEEGPGYWNGAVGSFFDCLEILEDMSGGKINLYSEPMITSMCEFITKVNIDKDNYVNFGACRNKLTVDADAIIRMGNKCGSEELTSFGKMMAKDIEKNYYYYYSCSYRAIKNAMTPLEKNTPVTKAKTGVWIEGLRMAVFREDSDTSKGLFLSVKGGSNNEIGNNNDIGSLVIFSNGKPVLVDPGIGSYDNGIYGPLRYERWYMQSGYHSCPTVKGLDQVSISKNLGSSNETCDTKNREVSMELKNAYPPNSGILSIVRNCKLSSGKIIITDSFSLDEENEIIENFTSHQEPVILRNGFIGLADNRTLSFDSNLWTPSIEKVENVKPYEDLNIDYWWGVPCLWRIRLRTVAKEIVSQISIE